MSATWLPRAQWDALVQGAGCAMCRELAADEQINAYGFTVARLAQSVLRLATNQHAPGSCVLICTRHVAEAHHLPPAVQAAFFADLGRASRAIEAVYRSDKLNLMLLGNLLPHLHCHIVPRSYNDIAPVHFLKLLEEQPLADLAAYQAQVAALRTALAEGAGAHPAARSGRRPAGADRRHAHA
jgi:diadenosine tetraphosphate (Ap4A) HIT family hydrolase